MQEETGTGYEIPNLPGRDSHAAVNAGISKPVPVFHGFRFRGDAYYGLANGDGLQHYRARADDGGFTDYSQWQNGGMNAGVRVLPDSYSATEDYAGREMDVIADYAIVLDNRACVHNAVRADDGAGIHHGLWHDDCSLPDNSGR